MQYFLRKIIVLIFLLYASASVESLGGGNIEDKKDSRKVHTLAAMDSTTLQLLEGWRKDSTGCLKIRNGEMALLLVEKLEIEGKLQSEVIALLGNPNKTWRRKGIISGTKRAKNYIYLAYDYDVYCEDGKQTPSRLNRCWLELVVDPNTRKVVIVTIVACT